MGVDSCHSIPVKPTLPTMNGALTRERVLDVAMAIVESEGPDGLTMRSLAGKLGVAVTAIYWHVGNKQELIEAVMERIGPEVGSVRVTGRTPEARIVSIARSLLVSLQTHRSFAGLAFQQGRLLELLAPARRALAEAFAQAGLRGTKVSDATNAVVQLVGERTIAAFHGQRWPEQFPGDRPLWEGTPPVDTRAARQLQLRPDKDHTFEVSLRALVRGLLAG
jgi:TetR/AcrR family tetracycline transcriptional repressor